MSKMTFGVIVGNRGFFPAELARQGRADILQVLKQAGHEAVVLSEQDTRYGSVETWADAKKCAALFEAQGKKIDGVIITLPNFGDEKAATEAIKQSGLDVPILIQAEPDDAKTMTQANRRDSFCGKISVCNNLRQAGIPFTLTQNHTAGVASKEFAADMGNFAAVCRVVKGLQSVRFGAIGARTGAFNTVRYSEKILEDNGITVETIDLSEIYGLAQRLKDSDPAVQAKLAAVKSYIKTNGIPAEALSKMARFGTVVDSWMQDLDLAGTAIQCWTSMEEYFGIVPCGIMSMMSQALMPSACEVDVTGLLGMYILQLAAESPSALLDWNNNYGSDPDKCVLFHCSNLPSSFFEAPQMDYHAIIAGSVGKENTYGTVCGRIAPGPATYCRPTTDDTEGIISVYLGEGEFTGDKLDTFGGYGVMQIPNLPDLLKYICEMGFEHHVAVSRSSTAHAIEEALENYLAWEVYKHE